MLKEFREFVLRGNVIDLAVAVVMGASFGAVVTAMVSGLITPLIAAVGGQPDFSALDFTINGSTFRYGAFINAVVSFLILASVVFFLIVTPVNRLMALRKTERPVEATTKDCPFCLSSVPIAASRCAFCTSELSAEPTAAV